MNYESTCPECGGLALLDTRRAELVCSGCQLVIADTLILPGTETPTEDERYSIEADDSQLLPQLYFSSRDARGAPVGTNLIWLLRRTAQTFNLKSNERSAITMESRIRRLATQLQFPSTLALRAIYLFRKTRKLHVIKKPSLHNWALALLYTACRDTRYVITVEDLVCNPDDTRGISTVWNYFKTIKRALGLKLLPFTVDNYITYYTGKLNIYGGSMVSKAVQIARTNDRPNATPHCVAAGALYIALQESGTGVSQKTFCTYANVSEISLRHWIEQLGGYRVVTKDAPEIDTSELVEELQDGQHVDDKGEQDTEQDGEPPASPEQPEGHNDRTNDDEKLDDGSIRRKEAGKRRKVRMNPVRRLSLPKHRAHKRDDTTYRKHTRVKRHPHITGRILRPRRRARKRARASQRTRRLT